MERDPKTGRFVKKTKITPLPSNDKHHPEYDELFDDVPTPPQPEDYEIMKGCIYAICIIAICIIIGVAWHFFH